MSSQFIDACSSELRKIGTCGEKFCPLPLCAQSLLSPAWPSRKPPRRQGNPTDSPYYSMPFAERTSKPVNVTLSPEVRATLEKLLKKTGEKKSELISRLILDAWKKAT